MSDPRAPSPGPTPPRPSNPNVRPSGGSSPARPSNPNPKVITATRSAPLPVEKTPLPERLKSGAVNLGLNAVGIAREAWADFRGSDRFFKYKALVVASWVVLSAAGLIVACPGQTGGLFANNHLGGRVVVAHEVDRTVLLVRNDGDKPWRDVIVIVNGRYRAAKGKVAAHDMFTLTPKQLLGDRNEVAPPDLAIRDVELRTAQGHATLLKDGEAP